LSKSLVAYEKIWATIDLIPKGKVASYGQIADLAGLPGRARLVGKSLGHVPKGRKVNWFKVLRSNGQLAFPMGSEQALLQTGLLQEDDVVVLNNRVKTAEFQWQPDLAELLFGLKY
jgi:methylated-DNA-protein-cysteine methyltransferase-like protein